ncbi:hypothetical protein [Methylobacterium frigidaeris]|uniref:Uncharacterized protein n=1 Tax=Methylobacterium frigidaeris TaxID=2038277 RepID=A0AA37M3Y0_9HYPH|nr:hypothetical protein [Methylobacterium frigidaeris]GJD61867.1 hypothetical protein MPEAHAMD_2015 [Methylobacterium frigidaeris]
MKVSTLVSVESVTLTRGVYAPTSSFAMSQPNIERLPSTGGERRITVLAGRSISLVLAVALAVAIALVAAVPLVEAL